MSNYFKILLIILIFATVVYYGFLTKISTLVTDFNNYVVVFFPTELLFIFSIIGVGVLYRLYKAFTD